MTKTPFQRPISRRSLMLGRHAAVYAFASVAAAARRWPPLFRRAAARKSSW